MKRSKLSRNLLLKLPKVDLHCHLDGSARPETLFDLAKKHGFKLPTKKISEFKRYVQVSKRCRSLADFLKKFEFFYDFIKFPDAVERIAYELCEDATKENIKYLEVRFAPYLQSRDKFNEEDVIKSTLSGLKEGMTKFGIVAQLIICIYRSLSEEINWKAIRLTEKYFGNGVCGMDLAGDEGKYSIDLYKKFFEYAKSRGIPITCHAGEANGAESIRKAIEFGARRIGHGIRLVEDKELFERVRDLGVVIEISLTSNVHTQSVRDYEYHPFRKFYESGLIVTLNTDDRGVSGIDLTHEYEVAVRYYDFGFEDIKKVIINGINSAFLSQAEKGRIKSLIEALLTKIKNYK